MSQTSAKLLVLGPPDGPQGEFVSAISEVKIRSSARTPSASPDDYVPMDFGRVQIAIDLDLQLFGFERDQISVVAAAVSPGIVGAILLVDEEDEIDPMFASRALDQLAALGVPTVLGLISANPNVEKLLASLGAEDLKTSSLPLIHRDLVKNAIVSVLEAALAAEEPAA